MNRKPSVASERNKRRRFTFLWVAILAVVVGALIYWEMTALLYILSTLGVTALLAVVALADLGGGPRISNDSASTQR